MLTFWMAMDGSDTTYQLRSTREAAIRDLENAGFDTSEMEDNRGILYDPVQGIQVSVIHI